MWKTLAHQANMQTNGKEGSRNYLTDHHLYCLSTLTKNTSLVTL